MWNGYALLSICQQSLTSWGKSLHATGFRKEWLIGLWRWCKTRSPWSLAQRNVLFICVCPGKALDQLRWFCKQWRKRSTLPFHHVKLGSCIPREQRSKAAWRTWSPPYKNQTLFICLSADVGIGMWGKRLSAWRTGLNSIYHKTYWTGHLIPSLSQR